MLSLRWAAVRPTAGRPRRGYLPKVSLDRCGVVPAPAHQRLDAVPTGRAPACERHLSRPRSAPQLPMKLFAYQCETCQKAFRGRERKRRFCSRSCYHAWYQPQRGVRRELTCCRCGKRFTTRIASAAGRRHCSMACRQADSLAREVACGQCGKLFTVFPCQGSQRSCSRVCQAAAARGPRKLVTLSCNRCDKTFRVKPHKASGPGQQKYCSRACADTLPKPMLSRTCVICAVIFQQRKKGTRGRTVKCCSRACANEYMRRFYWPSRRLPITGNHRRLSRMDWRRTRERVLDRDGGRCVVCGGYHGLLAHHVIPWIICHDDSETNLATICRSCHRGVEDRWQVFAIAWYKRLMPNQAAAS